MVNRHLFLNSFSVDQAKKSLPAIIQNGRRPFPKIHTGLRTTAGLQGSLAEQAQDHGDLAGVVNAMLFDAGNRLPHNVEYEHPFIGCQSYVPMTQKLYIPRRSSNPIHSLSGFDGQSQPNRFGDSD